MTWKDEIRKGFPKGIKPRQSEIRDNPKQPSNKKLALELLDDLLNDIEFAKKTDQWEDVNDRINNELKTVINRLSD